MAKADKFFSIRVTEDTRAALERSAKAHGRSFTREIAARVEESLSLEDALRVRFGDPATQAFSRLVAQLAAVVNHYKRTSWRSDQWTYIAFKAGIEELVARLAPGGPAEPPKGTSEAIKANDFDKPEKVGRAFGKGLLDGVYAFGAPELPTTVANQELYRELYRDLAIDGGKPPKRSGR